MRKLFLGFILAPVMASGAGLVPAWSQGPSIGSFDGEIVDSKTETKLRAEDSAPSKFTHYTKEDALNNHQSGASFDFYSKSTWYKLDDVGQQAALQTLQAGDKKSNCKAIIDAVITKSELQVLAVKDLVSGKVVSLPNAKTGIHVTNQAAEK